MTNLYGWSLAQKLPLSTFKWEEFSREELLQLIKGYNHETNEIGYLVEVDLDIDPSLHSYFQDFPPVISKMKITKNHLSPWSKLLLGDRLHNSSIKLAPNLFNKRKYITHIANLQLFLELGIELKAVHRALSFKQSSWLYSYIDFCTNKRRAALSDFEKNFWKLMINALFGMY